MTMTYTLALDQNSVAHTPMPKPELQNEDASQ